MKTIAKFLKPFHFHIFIAYSLTLVELATDLLFPFFLGKMINEGIMTQNVENMMMWGSIMFVLTILSFSSGIINSYFSSHVSATSAFLIREKLFEHIQSFTFKQLANYPSSVIVTRFTNDVRQVQNTIFMGLRIMVRAPLMVIGSIIMAFIVNVHISFIFLIIVPLLIAFLYWVLKKGSTLFNRVQEKVDDLNQVIQENISGMRVIRSFVRRDFENTRFSSTNTSLKNKTQSAFRFVESSMPILLFTMNLTLVFILWFGNRQLLSGSTTVGDVVAIVNYALRTVMAISMFTFIALAFSRAKASSERIEKLLLEETDSAHLQAHPIQNENMLKGKIEFDHVSFHYPENNVPILHHISFTIYPQETIAVIGATGSGKTSIFQLIPRLYEATSGNIWIDDQPIDQFSMEHLRHHIGFVPQSPLLFTGTIRDNITFGKENATNEEVVQAAKDAQIHETITSFPNGYDTVVGQKGVNLSGGQKQRLSIARALIRRPSILMLDDSTSALDIETEDALLHALQSYRCTTLLITQKISTAKRADRIMLIDDGKVIAFGSHTDLENTSPLYKNILASQVQEGVYHVQ